MAFTVKIFYHVQGKASLIISCGSNHMVATIFPKWAGMNWLRVGATITPFHASNTEMMGCWEKELSMAQNRIMTTDP